MKGNVGSNAHTDWASSDAEMTELRNVNNENDRVAGNYSNGCNYCNGCYNNRRGSLGPECVSESIRFAMIFIKCIFIVKYHKKGNDAYSHMRNVYYLIDDDIDHLFNDNRKSNCSDQQYCCFLTCLNCVGNVMPPTPSPYSSPTIPRWRKSSKTSIIPTTSTERQYNSLYRDFKHASQIELRDQMSSRSERIGKPEHNSKLEVEVEKEIRDIVRPFTSGFFTTLVDDYLKLFEEMVKGLILLKETGITLEDICSIGEERHNYYCQATKMDVKISSSQPYNAQEFEELLQSELRKQFQNHLHQNSQNMPQIADGNHTCDCEQVILSNNPYLTFLTEINCCYPHSCNLEEFDQILRREKKIFLKNCLKLLCQNEYFKSHSQSSLASDHLYAAILDHCTYKEHIQQDTEIYKMAIKIYNQTICHVQSAILAIFESMKYGDQHKSIFLPPTPDNIKDSERVLKISESKSLIEKSLTHFLKITDSFSLSEDEVFSFEPLKKDDDSLEYSKSNKTNERFQNMPFLSYEDELKDRNGQCKTGQPKYTEAIQKRHLQHDRNAGQEFSPLQQEIKDEHPGAKNRVRNHTYYDYTLNHLLPQNSMEKTPKNSVSSKNIQENQSSTCVHPIIKNIQENTLKTVFSSSKTLDSEGSIFNKTLFKRKNNDVRYVCVINYYKPEVSHDEAIAFLKKMEMEGGTLHYPHCRENTFLSKVEGPSFYFTVCCSDCHQELAPPQKLEAFKSEPKNTHRSKLIAYIIRKSRTSFNFPVRCGSCGFFLCEPQKANKHLCVPFHSPVKGYICASRLQAHECEINSSRKNTNYKGCVSDFINASYVQDIPKTNEKETKRCQSQEYLKSPDHKCIARSNSLPVLASRDSDIMVVMENTNEAADHSAYANASLKFEDAVTTILNMWTYEMIDYEKGASSPHLRSQILKYRKSLSIFIKRDIKEKLYYRHILSVFKRIENYESPILEFKDNVETHKGKMIKRSRSCHSKLRYEVSSTKHRSKSESLVNDFSTEINIFKHTLSELEKDASRPETSKNMASGLRYSKIETYAPTRCSKIDPEKHKGNPYLRSKDLNSKNISRPLSLHCETKQKSLVSHRRRSCSFTNESALNNDFSNQINAWKLELQELQKNVDSPHLRTKTLNRINMARPHSLHSEINQKTLANPHRRRSSYSLTNDSKYKDDFLNQINAWKHELHELQRNVQSPHLGSQSLNRKNISRPLSLHSKLNQEKSTTYNRRRSCSFETESSFRDNVLNNIQTNAWEDKLGNLQNVESSGTKTTTSVNNTRADLICPEFKHKTRVPTHNLESGCIINEKVTSQVNEWKSQLLKLEKNVESPYSRPKILRQKDNNNIDPLRSEPELNHINRNMIHCARIEHEKNIESPYIVNAGFVQDNTHHIAAPHCPQTVSMGYKKDVLSKSNMRNNESIPHLKNFDSSYSRTDIKQDSKSKQSSYTTDRRQTESIINKGEFSSELQQWKHELLKLQKSVESPCLKTKTKNNNEDLVSGFLDSAPKPTTLASTHCSKSELNDSITELKTWNHKLRELEKDATSSSLRPRTRNHKIKIRAVSLHTEPNRVNISTRKRPKSESEFNNFSTELVTWTHKLRTLEEDAKNSHTKPIKSNITISHCLNSELKPEITVNSQFVKNKDGTETERNVWMTPAQNIPIDSQRNIRTNITQYVPAVRRYSSSPRQLPAIPSNSNIRRHSHYETTNFVHLLSDRKSTHLNTGSESKDGGAHPASNCSRDDSSNYLRPYPDEGVARSRFFSQ